MSPSPRRRGESDRFNPSNRDGTCLWCGWSLPRHIPGQPARGRWGMGLFCTGHCAELFAHAAARGGFRFEPKKGNP